jgi:hypothetical protein
MNAFSLRNGLIDDYIHTASHFSGLTKDSLPDVFGFRSGRRGTHGSRSIMLDDLHRLLGSTRPDSGYEEYKRAILEENVLGKNTASTRLWSWKKLRELYGLDPRLAVFRCFRQLWESGPDGRPLLAMLCACARDPLLRLSVPVILGAPHGSILTPQDFSQAIQEAAPDRFSSTNLKAIGQRICSSWTQSGHLTGKKVRRRTHPVVTPETTVYALVLGRLSGARGPSLFSTFWTALLDAPKEELLNLAAVAAERGLINLKRVGEVVEVGFSEFITPKEEEMLRESD